MNNIMVCVTQQKNCERLIQHGHQMLKDKEDKLHIIHVAYSTYKFLGNNKENEALEYLFEKAREYDANLNVVKSEDVLKTLLEIAEENQITHIVMGDSHENNKGSTIIDKLQDKIKNNAAIIVVP